MTGSTAVGAVHARHLAIAPDIVVYTVADLQSSHLVVKDDRSILVDCHTLEIRDWIEAIGLPLPDKILHTHVQPEHCRESDGFPAAEILVHEELRELASDPEAYARNTSTHWENPAEWPTTMGRETYGIGGSITVLPPEQPLAVSHTFRGGDELEWNGLQFRVIPLPGHSRHHCGFLMEREGQAWCLFSGDLIRNDARLVNVYDLEDAYGSTSLASQSEVLTLAASLEVDYFLPSTGPVIANGRTQARDLSHAIRQYEEALRWTSGAFHALKVPEPEPVGRYHRVADGVYQMGGFGNCIVFIDGQGRGLMVDPGPCDYENDSREQSFLDDLELLEREAGLREIEVAMVTHFHGDHYDMAPALETRYPACRLAAWSLVADVIEDPHAFPYGCRLPWYDVNAPVISVDDRLEIGKPYYWNGIEIETMHLPGHCFVHAAYFLVFSDRRIAITGDTVQGRGDAAGLEFIISNHCVPDARAGSLKSYTALAGRDVDLNIGGHGSCFTNCTAVYTESVKRIEHALPFLRRLVPHGDLEPAFVRPWFPKLQVD